ncbi:MAG TPA: hypothetical protein VKU41_11350 [Polyangiaceae bacterium]|nr:hypothetical protein [Polyangiaceae bacterium]
MEAALVRAAEEIGLAEHYCDCVRPLLGTTQWPRCCGGNCEPCATVLIAVARRVHELLQVQP